MSDIRNHLLLVRQAFGPHPHNDFMLKHGAAFTFGPRSYLGDRMEQGQCYQNATLSALAHKHLSYCEGKVSCHGVPLDHAWCVDEHDLVVDPTIDGSDGHILEYFGVKFADDYLRRAILLNKYYGLLDPYYARKTAPKLYELGLDAGQQWLMNLDRRKVRC